MGKNINFIEIFPCSIIFYKCPIDIMAYIEAIDEYENIQSLYNSVEHRMKEIDLLVFVPIEKPDLILCPQPELSELRFQVNDILNNCFRDFGVEIFL